MNNTLAADLQRLDCLLADCSADIRDAIDSVVSNLVCTLQDHANAADFWEEGALRQQREIRSLYAQIEVLREKTRSLEACIRDMNKTLQTHEEVSRVMRRYLVSKERERMREMVYGRSAS